MVGQLPHSGTTSRTPVYARCVMSFGAFREWLTRAASEEHRHLLPPDGSIEARYLRLPASDWNSIQPQPRRLVLGTDAGRSPGLLPWEARKDYVELGAVELNLNWHAEAHIMFLRKPPKDRKQLEFYTLLLDFMTKDQYRRYIWRTRTREGDDDREQADAEAWEQQHWPVDVSQGNSIWQVVYQLPVVIWVRDVDGVVLTPAQGADGRAWQHQPRPPQRPPPGRQTQPWPKAPPRPPPPRPPLGRQQPPQPTPPSGPPPGWPKSSPSSSSSAAWRPTSWGWQWSQRWW